LQKRVLVALEEAGIFTSGGLVKDKVWERAWSSYTIFFFLWSLITLFCGISGLCLNHFFYINKYFPLCEHPFVCNTYVDGQRRSISFIFIQNLLKLSYRFVATQLSSVYIIWILSVSTNWT